MKIVNETGRALLVDFLNKNHRDARFITGCAACIDAWCAEAEQHAADGNNAFVEISGSVSRTGAPVIFTIPVDGLDDIPTDA